MPPGAGDASFRTVGEAISAYRRRMLQPGSRGPWSQTDLACASGTDQAHISRIESNQKHPQYPTLARICEALDLPPATRHYLFALAGFPTTPPLPNEEAVREELIQFTPLISTLPYPALLMDEGERVWHLNVLLATCWGACFGSDSHRECLSSIRGKRNVQFLFHPKHFPTWRVYFPKLHQVMDRHVGLFWRAYQLRPCDPDMNEALGMLQSHEEFRRRWRALEAGKMNLLLVEHDLLQVAHPRLGSLLFAIWRTKTAADERFILAHFTPVDEATARALSRLAGV
ncbi:MAG: helix-turn-helix domain-containing protein [Bryobacteraceae bacterium]|nr:helix-turn-helix domain-containing protein [Bryobacteraceae bacterium]